MPPCGSFIVCYGQSTSNLVIATVNFRNIRICYILLKAFQEVFGNTFYLEFISKKKRKKEEKAKIGICLNHLR